MNLCGIYSSLLRTKRLNIKRDRIRATTLSADMILQWATYRDAANQCSLSRIRGGIHPPADDIPGRLIGAQAGRDAFRLALTLFGDGG